MHLKKYYGNYIFLLLTIISFVLALIYKKETIYSYYGIVWAIFALRFNSNFVKEFGLSMKILYDRKLILFLIPTIVLSNSLLVLIKLHFVDDGMQANKDYLLLGFIFFNSVRIFGEEIIFRGFLLIKSFKENNKVFWILNLGQAILFGFIHTFVADNWNGKIAIGIYAFAFSIYVGWLNRKFNSILPSWIIHWMNGLHSLIFIYN